MFIPLTSSRGPRQGCGAEGRPNNSKSLLYLPSAAPTLTIQGSTSQTGNSTSKDIDLIWRHSLAGALRVTYHKRRYNMCTIEPCQPMLKV
uniref:Uncharacterized protein n=1 Tax=Vespula pensylvanica TaxID=30213 RepID=A0A834PH14_VESPE|nr:hypothetical protein H0235_001771 [Vespula pensylvanica]